MQYQNIVAAIDGSKATIPVLTAAVKSAIQNHAHLDLLTIEQIGQITDGYITDKTVSSDQTYSLVQATEERLDPWPIGGVADPGVSPARIHGPRPSRTSHL